MRIGSGWVGAAVLGLLVAGCSAEGHGADGSTCTSSSDCPSGTCVDGRCVERDGGDGLDAVVPGLDAGVRPGSDGGAGGDAGGSGSDGGGAGGDAGGSGSDGGGTRMDAGPPLGADSDGDGITDYQEGRFATGGPEDTDGDGTPDYLDDDSDGDGIPDSVEAGDGSLSSPPVDSDFDGIPDFRDDDSDDNGVPDSIEGAGDVDGDGRPDSRDIDNDGDGIDDATEIGSDPTMPVDTDGDGVGDYDEVDSDGDTIADSYETLVDTDGDGLGDLRDLDSDGDGYTDAAEAGDADLATDPIDTDGDSIPDFRDPDSDADGLSDSAERAAGTDPRDADSDGDGASDLIEVGAGTDPLDGTDSPRSRGDFVFVVPYTMPPSPTRDTLQFSTTLQKADVYFLVDTTGSMSGEIYNLRTSLSSTIIPMVRSRIPDAWFGVGGFDDYPVGPYGSRWSGDRPLYLRQQMTSSTTAAQAAVNGLSTHNGWDYPESHIPALWGLATRGSLYYGPTYPTCAPGYRAGACFRPDAVPVIVVITDAIAHNYPGGGNYSGISPTPPTYSTMIAALTALGARVVGVNSGGTDARNMLREFARMTGTVDSSGSPDPFVITISRDGSGLGSAAVDAIYNAAQVAIDVSARATDIADPGETVDAVAAFLDHLETRTTAAAGLTCTTSYSTYDRAGIDSDSYHDTFRGVYPGDPVCFDIVPKTNVSVMPTLDPQLFRARISVIGDGFTPLDERIIYFLVPPRIPDPNE